jgi:ABC-2 type transport system ATP-binding protein
MTDLPALSIEGLGHSFGPRRVLNNVSFSVAAGDFTVLLGLNGAGKTTLFSLATRLYVQRDGIIRIFGMDIRERASECLQRIGVVFQQPTLDLDLSVEHNLFYHAALHGLSHRETAQRIAAEIERVGLADQRRDKVRRLSGGQRRRVEIARCLLHQPRLLLLDEPTVGLDIASRQFMLDHMRRLCREEGIAALWATHLIDEVGEGAKVVVLHKGEVRAVGAAAQLLGQTRTPSMRAAFESLVQEERAAA